MTPTRETAIFGLWRRVNEIMTSEGDPDAKLIEIRNMIAEAGIEPNMRITTATQLTPLFKAEWMLGQWARLIDTEPLETITGTMVLNSIRNISVDLYERVVGAAS